MQKMPKSMSSIVQKSLFLAINNNSKGRLAQCDLVIEPPELKLFDPYDIRKATGIFKAGYEYASQLTLPEIVYAK
jgi:NTE family protein